MTDRRSARWTNLFDDLAAQLEQELEAERLGLHAEEERLRLGRLELRDRLVGLATVEGPATLVLVDSRTITVAITTVGRDWLAGDVVDGASRRSQCIVPIAAVAAVHLDAPGVVASLAEVPPPSAGLTARLGLSFVLRDLCRRRVGVRAVLRQGDAHGTIDRVGRDHFDLAVHESDLPRRREAISEVRIVPFAELVMLRL
jgi:hypothetical protein